MSLVTLLKYDLGACLQPRSVAILKENTPLTSVICETILILMISSSISQRPAHFGQFCQFLLAEHPPLKDTFTGSSITTLKPHGRVLRALQLNGARTMHTFYQPSEPGAAAIPPPDQKSVNLQYNKLVWWADGTNDSSTKRLMFQPLFFYIISYRLRALKSLCFYFCKIIEK